MAIYYIYKIYKPETDFIYIGSTTNFKDRKRTHKSRCIKESNKEYNKLLYECIRENGGWDEFKMEIIEELNDVSNREARKREEEYRVNLGANLNKLKCFSSEEDYRINRNLCTRRYYAKFRKEIQEKKSRKVLCECGRNVSINHIARHYNSTCHKINTNLI